ncbi:mandelate racemase/muconate lactonizing enzyme family protein [Rhodopila sp.]|jgi:L-alanine-DL-glutamate epimerase-like enolase superfamily enzyme|uniref:mandelate racemase/muconate lactonizing enzyme family protein n=1 Tax=Rhodopila sp. TaxID=2480087 RepID=UPI002C052633|nr:mandelate racemase/muconate lactonizing enzyme family protein [Rhodopila sp.]HVZ10630.1 mandelate racemase/muconate lactonizing enzyme family protein [Rhodopila sp.]
MKITGVETYWTQIPFDMGGKPKVMGGLNWQVMNGVWLRVLTDQGVEGWGEAFGHACSAATMAVLDTQLAPAILGQDARDIAGLRQRLAQAFHIYGRNGPHVFALSSLDIALWDIAGKAAGQPLWRLLGGTPAGSLRAYASLLRYGEASAVAAACERALSRGYRDVKLHEITTPDILAARRALGDEPRLMADVNCPWTVWKAIAMAREVQDANLTWLEEPVWPPGDFAGLARVRLEGGIPIAAGENAAGLQDFKAAFDAEAQDIAQPSVTKIGGPSAMIEIAALARAHAVRLVPHNAYFGAGYLASLHLVAALAPEAPFERLFIDLRDDPYGGLLDAKDGSVAVPDGPGLGRDPDMAVLRKYQVREPARHRL